MRSPFATDRGPQSGSAGPAPPASLCGNRGRPDIGNRGGLREQHLPHSHCRERKGAALPLRRQTRLAGLATRQHRLTVATSTPRRRVIRPNAAPVRSGRNRQVDGLDDLTAVQHRPSGADEETPRPARAPAGDADQIRDGAIDEQRGSGVGRGRGVADVARQSRPVADLHRTHNAGRFDQRRKMITPHAVLHQVRHHRARADAEAEAISTISARSARTRLRSITIRRSVVTRAEPHHQIGPARE